MSVTYNKLVERVHNNLSRLGYTYDKDDVARIITAGYFSVAEALSSGEEVFLERFGRFYVDVKPPRKIKSGLTAKEHQTKSKAFVRFNPFSDLTKGVQRYLSDIGVITQEDTDADN